MKLSEAMLKGWEIVLAKGGKQCRESYMDPDTNSVCALGAAFVGTTGITPDQVYDYMEKDEDAQEYLGHEGYVQAKLAEQYPVLRGEPYTLSDGYKTGVLAETYGPLAREIADENDYGLSIPEIAAILDRRGL